MSEPTPVFRRTPTCRALLDGTPLAVSVIADQAASSSAAQARQLQRAHSGHKLRLTFSASRRMQRGEVRDQLLQMLKELVGQWADVYTTQFFMYSTQFNSTVGYPSGYGSVQYFNDHHFHYGYFLRAAAMIGRADGEWLQAHLPWYHRTRSGAM